MKYERRLCTIHFLLDDSDLTYETSYFINWKKQGKNGLCISPADKNRHNMVSLLLITCIFNMLLSLFQRRKTDKCMSLSANYYCFLPFCKNMRSIILLLFFPWSLECSSFSFKRKPSVPARGFCKTLLIPRSAIPPLFSSMSIQQH